MEEFNKSVTGRSPKSRAPKRDVFLEKALEYLRNGSKIRFYGEQLWFDGRSINLGTRPKLLALVTALSKDDCTPKGMDYLIDELTGISRSKHISDRYMRSLRFRILKSLQRSRRYLASQLGPKGRHNVWLTHDRRSRTWVLFADKMNQNDETRPQ